MHLYLHVPYCAAKCPYCDFNSIAGREAEHAAYVEALIREVATLPPGPYATVFLGGGTPTALGAPLLDRLLAGVRRHIRLAPGHEWTCEANPGSADAERFRILAAHGVNRLSLGVQSTHAHHLRFLGRIHSPAEAEAAIAAACAAVPRVSADLMFGLPGQSAGEILADLGLYRRHALDHASVYHLAYEPGTEFHARRQRGELAEIADHSSRDLLALVADHLAGLGLELYETSNFARPGQACRHNLAYWRLRDYQAAGAGAVSTVEGVRLTREKHPGRYIEAMTTTGAAPWHREELTRLERIREAWMLGLRLADGVDSGLLTSLGDSPARWQPLCGPLCDLGLVELAPGRIRLSRTGRPVQDEVTVQLMP